VARRFLKERIIDRPALTSAQDVFDYLYHSMRDLKKERFRVIYLDSQNQIIDTADISEGTVNASVIHAREVIAGALKHNAVSLIFVHNHPSGNPQPSRSDIAVTRDLVYAAAVMELKVLDHIVIGDNTHYSFAADGLIEKYELQFLRLKSRETPPGAKRATG
jgi:DNA repair protein RadC